MVDIVLEILGAIFGTAVDEWFQQQSWWVKGIVIATIVFVVLMILYFTVFLPFFSQPRG